MIFEFHDAYLDRVNSVVDALKLREYDIEKDRDNKELERMTDYLLNAKDIKEDKELEYIFYTDTKLFKKTVKDYHLEAEKLDFYMQIKNFKKEKKQVISKKDLEDPILESYQQSIDYLKSKSNIKLLSELKTDQLIAKEDIKRTIYLKHISPDTTENEWQFFDFNNPKHVYELLRYKSDNLNTTLGCIVADLDNLLDSINLNDTQKEILYLRRDKQLTHDEIGGIIGIEQQSVVDYLNDMIKRVIKEHKRRVWDWFNLNWVKGKYKTCSKCKEVKLVCEFSPDKRNKDGLQGKCKDCDNSRKTLHKKRS